MFTSWIYWQIGNKSPDKEIAQAKMKYFLWCLFVVDGFKHHESLLK